MSQVSNVSNAGSRADIQAMHAIERQVFLRAPRSRVWEALTDTKKFCQWFGVNLVDGEFKAGATVRMSASEEYGGDFDIMVEHMHPQHLFTWRWHPGARDPSVDYDKETPTLVEFRLADSPGGTTLTIKESGFDNISLARRARVFGQNCEGWDGQIRNLERYVNQAS
jgi:uncharacterized protein YndB with AHSA1/START domain